MASSSGGDAAPGDRTEGDAARLREPLRAAAPRTPSAATEESSCDPGLDSGAMASREAEHFACLAARLQDLHPDEAGLRARPVGLAVSGGGTRAAAFHAGVFWQLASAGILKDVEHLCAVSGGGYTAASYVSHLCKEAAQEPPSGSLDDWYRKITAKFVLRMQRNINYLVDPTPSRRWRMARQEDPEERGSSCCPRIFDFPLFIGALVGSMTASPLLLVLHTVWPLVFSIELTHGAMLRRTWCDPGTNPGANQEFTRWIWQSTIAVAVLAAVAVVLGCGISAGVCPRLPENHQVYLYSRSVRHVLERGAILYAVYALVVCMVLALQLLNWGFAAEHTQEGAWIRALCHHYIVGDESLTTCSDYSVDTGGPWYKAGDTSNYLDEAWSKIHAQKPPGSPSWDAGVAFTTGGEGHTIFGFLVATVGGTGLVLVGIGALALRSKLLKWVATILVPLCYFLVVVQIARWKVFGPITVQRLIPRSDWSQFSTDLANTTFLVCACGALLTLPFYDAVQKLAHLYYRRALKRAFFADGRDISFASIVHNPYCPNLLFGACVHDFRKPWDKENHVDFTISSLFVGCERTGFFMNPPQASLARLMTIAGAATDATFLLNADILAIRFVLSVIALRFGDFIRLRPEGAMSVRVESRIVRQTSIASLTDNQHWISRWLQGLLDRLPAACPFFLAHLCLLIGGTIGGTNSEDDSACTSYRVLVWSSLIIYISVATLSFFAYIRPLQCLMKNPMIQQFQMLFMHRYKAMRPPPYLYISDGGLIEPLGMIPLLRRRLARVVVSDAAEDVDLTMRCLRDAFLICRSEGLCSFYDPRDPCRDLEFVLQEFRTCSTGFLHLGIRYEPAGAAGSVTDGELFYVRMRLLPGDVAPVRALLTEAELLGAPPAPGRAPAAADPEGPHRSDFGGACLPAAECGGCCAGRRFPNYGVSNQFLTSLHFANLCGLGAELSQPLVHKMRPAA